MRTDFIAKTNLLSLSAVMRVGLKAMSPNLQTAICSARPSNVPFSCVCHSTVCIWSRIRQCRDHELLEPMLGWPGARDWSFDGVPEKNKIKFLQLKRENTKLAEEMAKLRHTFGQVPFGFPSDSSLLTDEVPSSVKCVDCSADGEISSTGTLLVEMKGLIAFCSPLLLGRNLRSKMMALN